MTTFAAALVTASRTLKLSRPLAQEAVAAVLLDRRGVTTEDVETGRVILTANEDVRNAVSNMADRIWGVRVADARAFSVPAFERGLDIVIVDRHDVVDDEQTWIAPAGETGAGVLMLVQAPDDATWDVRSWSSKLVELEPLDADGVIPDAVELVTGVRPTLKPSFADISLGDIRSALGPRASANAAVGAMTTFRDRRNQVYEERLERSRQQAAKMAAKDLLQGMGVDVRPVHERDTPLSKLSGFGVARAWGLEVAAELRAYMKGELSWADVDKGVLLSGPPGVGKTRFARALAAEAGVPFHPTSFSSLIGGSSTGYTVEKELKKFWTKAKESAPCVVFFDEMDSVPGRDFKPDHNSSYFNAVNNAFLEILDGAEPRDGVLVIAASNHPERIDPALKRAGRLDREIAIPMPSIEDIGGIIRHHLGTDTNGMDDQVRIAARACRGMSPADIEQVCRDARRRARRDLGRTAALPGDIVWVLQARRGAVDAALEHMVAIHEAGHAVNAIALGIDVEHVDAERRQTVMRPHGNPTATKVRHDITMTLAGRAAEQILLGDVTTGSTIDLRAATSAATRFHAEWGFGAETGLVSLDVRELAGWGPLHHGVKTLVDECYASALKLVRLHRDNIEAVAAALVQHRYLDVDEVRALIVSPLKKLVRPNEPEPSDIPEWAPTKLRRVFGFGPRRVPIAS